MYKNLKGCGLLLAGSLLVYSFALEAHATLILPPGSETTIDSYINDDVAVGESATVNIVSGGTVNGTVSGEGYTVNADGGQVLGGIELENPTPVSGNVANLSGDALVLGINNPNGNALAVTLGEVNISDNAILVGTGTGNNIYSDNGLSGIAVTLNMTGGSIYGGATLTEADSGDISISGGFIDDIYISFADTLSVTGGEFGDFRCSQCYADSIDDPLSVSGGLFHSFGLGETGNFTVSGGLFDGHFQLYSGSDLDITGGLFDDMGMILWEENSADFFGYNLKKKYLGKLESPYISSALDTFLITGMLLDGNEINLPVYIVDYGPEFPYGSVARIYNVPEPSSLLLMGIGLAGIWLVRRRKQT